MIDNNYLVYRHRRLDNNDIFYVGISSNSKRPFDFKKRSKFWKRVTSNTKFIVEIIVDNISKDKAIDLEMLLISEYGRRDLKTGTLVNMTEGGEGTKGCIPHNKGGIGFKHSEETLNMMRGSNNSMYGKKHNEATKLKIADKSKGRLFSDESRLKMSNKRKGHLNSQAKPILDINTGVFYYSMNEIVELYGYKKPNLSMMLNNKRTNKTSFIYA